MPYVLVHKVKVIYIILCNAVCQVYSISLMWYGHNKCLVLCATWWSVVCSVPRAAVTTSSCEFWEFMPGYHSPEVQANVKIKSLVKSATRCPHLTGHVVDYKEY